MLNKYDVSQAPVELLERHHADDCYYLSVEGWKAELTITSKQNGNEWDCDLVPNRW
jgi:hypothetical protein